MFPIQIHSLGPYFGPLLVGRNVSKKEAQDVMDVLSNMDEIEFLGENGYGIPSQEVEGKTYTVVVGDGAQHCDCPGSRKGTHTCKHIHAARMFSMMDDIVVGKSCGADAMVPGPQRQSKLPRTHSRVLHRVPVVVM